MHLDDEGVLKFLVIVVDGLSGKSGKSGTAPVFYCFRGLPIVFGLNVRPNNFSNLVAKVSSPAGRPVEVHSLILFNIPSSSVISRYLSQSSIAAIDNIGLSMPRT